MPRTETFAQLARGFAMGAADIVPGVSGGTIALVTGIYERLIANVHEGASSLKQLLSGNPKGFVAHLKAIEWAWIIPLAIGLFAAIAALSSIIERLLKDHPQAMAGLFFGLVVGSALVAWRLVGKVTAAELAMMAGVAVALFLLLGLRTDTEQIGEEVVTEPLWMFFIAGSIAICAMILPGISGSFILVMMGMYLEVLGAVNARDLLPLIVFMVGAVLGLSLFSSLLNWVLERYRSLVLAAMIGLMLGSLRVLWPWPGGTNTTTLGAPEGTVLLPIVLAVVGFAVVVAVELTTGELAEAEDEHEAAHPDPARD